MTKRITGRNGASMPLWAFRVILVPMVPLALACVFLATFARGVSDAYRYAKLDVRREIAGLPRIWRGEL